METEGDILRVFKNVVLRIIFELITEEVIETTWATALHN
jgi:hypothetical protein